jgi:hypothetical protein
MTKEGERSGQETLQPFELPLEVAAFLRGEEIAMVTQASDQGTVYVLKSPAREITSVAGRVAVQLSHDLYEHPSAPVIRTVVKIYDQRDRPLGLETVINVDEPDRRQGFAALAEQEELLLFYDGTLSHQLTKRVRNTAGAQMRNTLNWADRVRAELPDDRYVLDAAKADVMAPLALLLQHEGGEKLIDGELKLRQYLAQIDLIWPMPRLRRLVQTKGQNRLVRRIDQQCGAHAVCHIPDAASHQGVDALLGRYDLNRYVRWLPEVVCHPSFGVEWDALPAINGDVGDV